QPDVALIDIRMPPSYTTEGIAAATTIPERHPNVSVLVLSQHVDVDYALELIKTHPTRCGYLLKDRITKTHIRHILAELNLPTDTHHNRRVLAVLTYLCEDST